MRYPLTPNFCLVFALHASLLAAACGDPLFASFTVGGHDDSTSARDAADEGSAGEADPIEPNAGGRDASADAMSTGLTPQGCYVLPDLSIISNVDSGVVVAREATSQGCAVPDAGGATSAGTTYMRRDGLPMVNAGSRYSFRWDVDTVLSRVRVLGGNEACSIDSLLFMEPGTAAQGLNLVTCSDFSAARSALYLRLYGYGHDFYSLQVLNANVAFTLCPGSCPPNTKLVVDGSVPSASGADAGTPHLPPQAP